MVFSGDVLRLPLYVCNMAQTHALVLHNPYPSVEIWTNLDTERLGRAHKKPDGSQTYPYCVLTVLKIDNNLNNANSVNLLI